MTKKLFVLFFLLNVSSAFGQYTAVANEEVREDNITSNTEGLFQYSVNATEYRIQISLLGNFYKEFNSNGAILSQGEFRRQGDNAFQLIPSQIDANALIQTDLFFSFGTISAETMQINLSSEGQAVQSIEVTRVN